MTINYFSARRWLLLGTAGGLACTGGASAALAAETEQAQLEEVVVTAERRETNLQKTPVTVNVVKGEQLAESSVTDLRDLQQLVPGLRVNPNAGRGNEFTIRGVSGMSVGDPSNQPGVALLVDGVYSQAGVAGSGALFDVAQVEVVKGPQGTLVGRNATAGVVTLVTQRPKFENSGQASIDFGSSGRINASGLVNFKLGEKVAVRASVQSSKHDGWYQDGFTNEDTQGGRIKILFAPNDDVSLFLNGDYSKVKGKPNGSTTVLASTGQPIGGDPWAGPTSSAWHNATYNATNFANYGPLYGRDAKRNNINWGVSPELEWKFGSATLTAIGSYKKALRDEVSVTYVGQYLDSKEKSFEVRLASNQEEARLKWQGGAYYYKQDLYLNQLQVYGLNLAATGPILLGGFGPVNIASTRNVTGMFCAPSFPAALTPPFQGTCSGSFTTGRHNTEENLALFTQETFSFTDALRLTLGGRWQREEAFRSRNSRQAFRSDGTLGAVVDTGEVFRPTPLTDSAITWKAGVDFDLTPTSMLYAVVSTGWKAGVPQNYDAPYDQQQPEKLTAYTIGSKNRFLDQRLQVNLEAFYWDYTDRQVALTCVPVTQGGIPPAATPACNNVPGLSGFVQTNAKKSHVQGASVELTVRPVRTDTVTLNLEFLDQAVHDNMGDYTPLGLTCRFNCAMDRAPRYSSTVSWRHLFELGDRGRVTFDINSKIESGQWLGIVSIGTVPANVPASYQGSYGNSNVGLGYSPQGNKWNLRAYVNNATNVLVKDSGSGTPNPANLLATGSASYQSPRTYGVQFRADF
jgi:iron complex outermembrane receptor protein